MANPVISRINPKDYASFEQRETALTMDDVVVKTSLSLGLLSIIAVATFIAVGFGILPVYPTLILSSIIGLGLVIASVFKRNGVGAGIALSYAAVEGVFVGTVSYVFSNFAIFSDTPNGGQVVLTALVGTIGVFFGMLFAYKTGLIRVTPLFTKVVIGATLGILVLALVNVVFYFVGIDLGLRGGGTIGILFSLFAIVIAALNLALDFNRASKLVEAGAPQRIAWDISLGLTVTLVWLYVEMLRLTSIFSGDD